MIQTVVPTEQAKAFHLAICERIGVDPGIVTGTPQVSVTGGDELAEVSLTCVLPADEVVALFNGAGK